MKKFFKKPLGLAVAATLAVGLSANSMAATDANALGDLAIVPYYTVMDNYVTGVHITNTTNNTQVVKFRLRRDSDSADVLDFNIIMSPKDVWTGFVTDATGTLRVGTGDTTCTAPLNNGSLTAPDINRDGAEEGYIEIIGMGQLTDEATEFGRGAKHVNGEPRDCSDVSQNFRNVNVLDAATTQNNDGDVAEFVATPAGALKVSYFIRDAVTGMEFGDNAQHINTGYGPHMSNQQTGLNSGDTSGFDFPDLDGGPANGGVRGMYDNVIRPDLAASTLINDWSFVEANGVSTDWVVTVPGQYLMVDPSVNPNSNAAVNNRDLPLTAQFTVYDREEDQEEPGGLVVSPSPAADSTTFPEEVNVVEWGGKSVFNTAAPIQVTPTMDAESGWAELALISTTPTPLIFDLTDQSGGSSAAPTTGIPVLGFTAWQRTFGDVSKNYGRIVAHSRQP